MLPCLRQGGVIDGIDVVEQGVVEVVHHRGVDGGQAQLLGVQHLEALGILLQEPQAALVQLPAGALGDLHHKARVAVGDLKGAVEVLPGVDTGGVNPLHLHEDADALHVGGGPGGPAAHGVQEAVVFVLLGESLGPVRHLLPGLADDAPDALHSLVEGVVVSVALGVVDQFHRQLQCALGLLPGVVHVPGVGGAGAVEGIEQQVVGEFGDLRLLPVGEQHHGGAGLPAQLGGGHGLRGVAGVAGHAQHGVLPKVLGGAVDKLVAVDPPGLQPQALPLHKDLGGVQRAQRAAAAHEVDVLHPAVLRLGGKDLPDDLGNVPIVVSHDTLAPSFF